MKSKVHYHIALGLTVCLATCELVAANNSSLQIDNKWIPVIETSARNKTAELHQSGDDCCARLSLDTANGERDLEVAASVMAPIERVLPSRTGGAAEQDDEHEDEPEEDGGPEESRGAGKRQPQDSSWRPPNAHDSLDGADGAAAEQEAAEASEAEAANRSALDEQLQQQRQIIMAQARSEAKAIREQQEALLRQQNLQQHMQLRATGRQDLHSSPAPPTAANQQGHLSMSGQSAATPTSRRRNSNSISKLDEGAKWRQTNKASRMYHGPSINRQQQKRSKPQHRANPADVEFSDQPNRKSLVAASAPFQWSSNLDQQQQAALLSALAGSDSDSDSDSSSHSNLVSDSAADAKGLDASSSKDALLKLDEDGPLWGQELMDDTGSTAQVKSHSNGNGAGDLHTAAQHHYGSHYGSVKGHHGDYYQFAESHKKGQFHSGFKRGGKKFQVSGHASQHKSHAEGHVNWHGKKGKGVQYWDYKHKNKKHYGHY